jgi:CDGSH-type Zn-finger protein
VSRPETPSVVACPNGPLIVRGDVELLDEQGNRVDPHRRTVALCRCGASAIRPFCDGSHKLVGFRTVRPERDPAIVFDEPAQNPGGIGGEIPPARASTIENPAASSSRSRDASARRASAS